MSFAPASIVALGAYWTHQGGINSGIVGGATVIRGYHVGKDRIRSSTDYSIQTARDKRGLTNAASALDLGRLDGSLHNLQEFSKWFVNDRCRKNAPGTSDVREVIYSPDGRTVLRWDRQRGYASAPRPGESDNSHTWHTHISFYRDSEHREKVSLFRPYFETEEADVPIISTYIPGWIAVIQSSEGAKVRVAPSLTAAEIRTIPAGSHEDWTVTGWVKGDMTEASDQWITRWAGSKWEYSHKVNVASCAPPPDLTPYSQADIDKAVFDNEAKWDAWVGTHP